MERRITEDLILVKDDKIRKYLYAIISTLPNISQDHNVVDDNWAWIFRHIWEEVLICDIYENKFRRQGGDSRRIFSECMRDISDGHPVPMKNFIRNGMVESHPEVNVGDFLLALLLDSLRFANTKAAAGDEAAGRVVAAVKVVIKEAVEATTRRYHAAPMIDGGSRRTRRQKRKARRSKRRHQ